MPWSDTVALTLRWADALCTVPSTLAAEVARVLGVDLAAARRLGSQLILTPPAGAPHVELVLGRDGGSVACVEFTPVAATTAAALAAAFGPWRQAPPGPHQAAPTLFFDGLRPNAAARGCTVLARMAAGWPEKDVVESVLLYPQPRRAG